MLKFSKAVPVLLMLVGLCTGCGGSAPQPGGTMQDLALGISLQAPVGWQVRSTEPGSAWKGESTGVIVGEPMHGRMFQAHVQELTEQFGARVVSRTAKQIDGHDAVEAVIAYPNAGTKALKVYIHRPPNLIEVSFVTPAEEFDDEEDGLRQAMASIRLQ